MIYVFMGAMALNFLALLWMAKLLGEAGAYKQAFLVVFIGTLGWCMPLLLQVFVLATFVTLAVQWWDETRPAVIAWGVTVAAMFAIGQVGGGARAMISDLRPGETPAAIESPTADKDLKNGLQ